MAQGRFQDFGATTARLRNPVVVLDPILVRDAGITAIGIDLTPVQIGHVIIIRDRIDRGEMIDFSDSRLVQVNLI